MNKNQTIRNKRTGLLILCFFISLIILPSFWAEYQVPKTNSDLPPAGGESFDSLLAKGDLLMDEWEYEQALVFFQQLLPRVPRGKDSLQLALKARLLYVKGNLFWEENKDSALVYIRQSADLFARLEDWEHQVLALLDQALLYLNTSDFSNMKAVLLEAEKNATAHLPANSETLGNIFHLLGVANDGLGDFDAALERTLASLRINQTLKDTSSIAMSYNNLGSFYEKRGDYDRAIEYLLASLDLVQKNADPGDLSVSYDNLSGAYGRKMEYEKALQANRQALDLLRRVAKESEKPQDFSRILSNRGILLTENGQYDSAAYYLNRALKLGKDADLYLGEIYHNLGYLARFQQNYRVAVDNLDRALVLASKRYKRAHPILGRHYRHRAYAHARLGNLDSALADCQLSLETLVPSFSSSDPHENPPLKDYSSPIDLVKMLRDKGEILRMKEEQDPGNGHEEAALKTFQLAVDLVDSLRNVYQEGSQQFWNRELRPLFEMGIASAAALHQREAKQDYLEIAFRFAEKSKSALLSAAVQESAARRQAGLPDTVLQLEKQLKIDIAFYQNRIFSEQQSARPDSSKLLLWQRELLEGRRDYEALLESLEREYPAYFQLRYQDLVSSVSDVQSFLKPENVLVEYFFGENHLYIFAIGKETAAVKGFAFDQAAFSDSLQYFLDQVRDREQVAERGRSPEMFAAYVQAATELYERLLKPVLPKPAGQLIIIPDGPLGYLPFELLLSKAPPAETAVNYASLAYLLRDSRLRYEYSATLLLQPFSSKRRSSRFAGFAPTYGSDLEAKARDAQVFCEIGGPIRFGNLAHNQDEVTGIARLWKGSPFTATEATEARFKDQASSTGIIHLAMHGFVNECNPLYSGLIFAQEDGEAVGQSRGSSRGEVDFSGPPSQNLSFTSADDGFLHAYEIYNLSLNAELAVLSACNTGTGLLERGEGIMSLARAFKYAGCSNIITSLWQADDAATAQIMVDFYRLLREGKGKDEALRQAKLAYLDAGGRNHPFFWGTFILIGDDKPLKGSGLSWPQAGLLALGLLAAGFGLWMWNRRRVGGW